jgi:hypothetical protein
VGEKLNLQHFWEIFEETKSHASWGAHLRLSVPYTTLSSLPAALGWNEAGSVIEAKKTTRQN